MVDRTTVPRFGGNAFLLSLAGLALLPLLPEVGLFLSRQSDLKNVAPIFYYEAITALLLLTPVLLLPRLLSRLWVVLVALATAVSTLIVGFYTAANGTRWNLTAHAALMQTNSAEARSYLAAFARPGLLAWIALLAALFVFCTVLNVRSSPPVWRTRLLLLGAGFVLAAYGLANAWRYGRHPLHAVTVSGSTSVRVFGASVNMLHPLSLFATTDYNFRTTHRYYLGRFNRDSAHLAQLAGATTLPGAVSPRIIVVVIGESATRRHWSLYGYPCETTPRLTALAPELHVFTDVVATSVGTLDSFRTLFTTSGDSLPVFNLFSGAGYTTHWFSAQFNQGFDDLELAALVSSCSDTVFLSGAYDENLVPLLAKVAARPGRQMIFLNLMGSHVRYEDRYPTAHAVFSGNGERDRRRATYDNSIRYTDTVLAQLIATLRRLDESAGLVYFSDHGEDVYDSRPDKYLFRDDLVATDPMYEVPFVVWLSPQYARDNPETVRTIAAATTRPYQNRSLYHGLLDLARLTHPLYDATADPFSPAFVPRERHVGANQRLYQKSP